MVNPVLVALDFSTSADALDVARTVAPYVGGFKVGLELLMGEGPDAVSKVVALGAPVFVDAKLHDIPSTVEEAARAIGARGARWVTVHASGGAEMVEAAVAGLGEGSEGNAGVLAVTVLTSIDEPTLRSLGVNRDLGDQVAGMASLASNAGAEGVICSVHEIGIAKQVAPELLAITPGIRLAGGESHDQKRVATPEEAMAAGADYLVVGRSITRAEDLGAAARAVAISAGFSS